MLKYSRWFRSDFIAKDVKLRGVGSEGQTDDLRLTLINQNLKTTTGEGNNNYFASKLLWETLGPGMHVDDT